MLTKTKIALAVALVIGSASIALVENEDGNLVNHPVTAQAFQSRNATLGTGQAFLTSEESYLDRAPQKTGK